MSVTLFVVIQCAILLVVYLGSHSSYLVGRSSSDEVLAGDEDLRGEWATFAPPDVALSRTRSLVE